ncbi:MAG TPA: DUF4271 domain-containing protein [Prevotella sp.]
MLQSDSIAFEASEGLHQAPTVRRNGQPTPAQVLKWLPKNATPAQQDSAIQAHIKPAKIHWSGRPDTLHLPGHSVGKSFRDVSLPQYYRESFFSESKFFHPELSGGRLGVAGDPVPYTIAGDNLITSLLIGCFLLAAVAFSQSRRFIARQAKNFFYVPRSNVTSMTETSGELRFQLFLVLQTCLLFALTYFFNMLAVGQRTFILDQYQIMGIYAGVFLLYFILKALAYTIANLVFFDRKSNERWMKSYLFLISTEGVALFPLVLLQVYFNMPSEHAFACSVVVIILFKLLSLYKEYLIFFGGKRAFLQIILYFCALEAMPFAVLWGILMTISNYLKVNY